MQPFRMQVWSASVDEHELRARRAVITSAAQQVTATGFSV